MHTNLSRWFFGVLPPGGGRWACWLVLTAVAAFGLPQLRVENSLDQWIPGLEAVGPYRSYVVLGWARGSVDRAALVR